MNAEAGTFEPRGVPAPGLLVGARLQLHWAAQIVAGVGRALIPAGADDSNSSLEWVATGLLAGGVTPSAGGSGLRLGLRLADPALVLLDARANPAGELSLEGRTLDEAGAWAAEALGDAARTPPPYEMPPHAIAHGAKFSATESAACAELSRWYATADRLLRAFARSNPLAEGHASPVRCWPHHFDIATLIELSRAASGQARTIGVGLSPGDGSCAEPYFYVTPWPHPKAPTLPALPAGAVWHRNGWFGAGLTGTTLFAGHEADDDASPSRRAEVVWQFLTAATAAAAALLDATVRP